MDSQQKYRRLTISLVTLIVILVLAAFITAPLLVAFTLGFAIGGISAFLSVIYLLVKK